MPEEQHPALWSIDERVRERLEDDPQCRSDDLAYVL